DAALAVAPARAVQPSPASPGYRPSRARGPARPARSGDPLRAGRGALPVHAPEGHRTSPRSVGPGDRAGAARGKVSLPDGPAALPVGPPGAGAPPVPAGAGPQPGHDGRLRGPAPRLRRTPGTRPDRPLCAGDPGPAGGEARGDGAAALRLPVDEGS